MVEWWFGYIDSTEEYKMWEPKSHVGLKWDENRTPGRYIGASYVVKKKLGGRFRKLSVYFHEPSEFLDSSKFAEAKGVTAICANAYDPEKVPLGRFIHLVRDTDYGCEMRSRFWLFKATESGCMELMQHCMEEMGNLADFLPDLYAKENLSLLSNM